MKVKGIALAMGLSCISLSVYAADQVIKEDMTPTPPEGAITVEQILPQYGQPAPTAAQPTTTNPPQTTTQQPMMQPPAAPTTAPAQQPMQPMPQNTMSTQPTAPQNTMPGQQPQQPMMQAPPQRPATQQNPTTY